MTGFLLFPRTDIIAHRDEPVHVPNAKHGKLLGSSGGVCHIGMMKTTARLKTGNDRVNVRPRKILLHSGTVGLLC